VGTAMHASCTTLRGPLRDMATIALISCVKTKSASPTRADELYTSPLFRKSLLYALTNADQHFVLSAKYGLVSPDTIIEPYERTLKLMREPERRAWAANVAEALSNMLRPRDTVLILAGKEYYRLLLPHLQTLGCYIRIPFESESLGKRLASLTSANDEPSLERQLNEFYRIIRKLYIGQDGGRRLGDTNGKMPWPERGVYFFMEDGEQLTSSRYLPLKSRVTRVGTHAVSKGSKTTLWDRLSTHRGVNSGSGSHRSSIFRLHLGAALQANGQHPTVPSWGVGQVADRSIRDAETSLETNVSRCIGSMRILWLDIGDEASPSSDRSFIERNVIGLLSRSNILRPSKSATWLGSSSTNYRIALGGLWNLNYLFEVPHPKTLDVLSEYVNRTIKGQTQGVSSIAPKDWYKSKSSGNDPRQLKLGFE
jgi:hypothetical protein